MQREKPLVMIIDDEESIHMLYSEELGEEGYEISSVMNGEEGLKAFEKEEPDLVILDINMPGMDGIEVLRKMKQQRPDVPVILSSAYPEYKQDIASWASDDYIVKSFDLTGLKESIKKHLAKRGQEFSDPNH
jgi:DNA-binding response OmpR family regulator